MVGLGTQLIGLLVLIVPLVAIQWNIAGRTRRGPSILAPQANQTRWRLEIYSTSELAAEAMVDPVDVPFPVKRVRSAKVAQAAFSSEPRWTLPRVEVDVEVVDPFADDALTGLFGDDHELRMVTGNEAVVDTPVARLRIRSFRFH